MEWFEKFPALWGAVGGIAGAILTGIAAVFVFRQFGARITKASDVLVDLQTKQLASMERAMVLQQQQSDRSLQMQKDHYDAELGETRRKAEQDLGTMTEERNTYRQTLHDERGELGNQLTEAKLKIKELESRPDLTSLLEFETKSDERREIFYGKLGMTMGKMSGLLDSLVGAQEENDRKAVERMQAFVEPVLEAMREVVESCNAMKRNARARKKIVAKASARLRSAARVG